MPDTGGIMREAIEEAVGLSSKKWALVVVALIVGAIGAMWLIEPAGPHRSGNRRGQLAEARPALPGPRFITPSRVTIDSPFWAACGPLPVLGGRRSDFRPFGRPVTWLATPTSRSAVRVR